MYKRICLSFLVLCAALLLGVILSSRFRLEKLHEALDSAVIGPEGVAFVHRLVRFPSAWTREHEHLPEASTDVSETRKGVTVDLNSEDLPKEVYRSYIPEKRRHEIKINSELEGFKIGQILLGEHILEDELEYKEREIVIWMLEDGRNVVLVRNILYNGDIQSEEYIQDEKNIGEFHKYKE
ncbi:signal peptide-containing protein [Theileria equi strain WA]|uniref:Signal peptide-containing protein n=1 Tax=Theileria equi strain WA TaxID=1537102 RepID=L0AUR6_THEEQ|nr:signal peptide-containing protein [Theileria equi strain WA]AFZ79362.1 signal peptide-containing protein [Theileria equi strain WA]|eukprot:XP_004829028.1 signal peptide-containing protein [Theileria equi strain WA]